MEDSAKPSLALAKQVLPKPLLEAIQHVFKQSISGCALVGGTALSGFYAGHRRSDDMDLFVKSEVAFRSTVLAVRSLSKLGAELKDESLSAQYYHANCTFRKHTFTVDVVLDENLFKVGVFQTLSGGICVVDLGTILKMKAATLVSRCGEKDLYDLVWLLNHFPKIGVAELIDYGREIDAGINPETLLASIGGTTLRESACQFAIVPKQSSKEVLAEIKRLQKMLIRSLIQYAREQPAPPLASLVKWLKKAVK